MATYNVTMNGATNTALLDEQMIYGAERLGAVQSVAVNVTDSSTITNTNTIRINQLGRKNYELTNHLGNVNAVITDRKVLDVNYVAGANYEFSNATLPTFTKTGSCGVPTVAVTNGQAVVTSGACTTTIYSDIAVTPARTYTFSVDIDRSGVAGLDVELYYISSTGTVVAQIIDPSFINIGNGRFTYTFTPPSTTAFFRYKFSKTSTPAGVYKLDNLRLNTVNTRYMAVVIMKSDYYPFGMQMSGRTYNTGDYRFGYNGMEKDKEMKGDGNSYTTEFRQYDPRLGRWMSLDPLMMKFPWMSPYVGFDNNPVYYTDPYGLKATNGDGLGDETDPYSGSECDDGAQVAKNVLIATGEHVPGTGADFGSGSLDSKGLSMKLYGDTYFDGQGALIGMRMAWSDQKLLQEVYELADDFADGAKAEAMVKGIVDHFKENTGAPYSSGYLTTAASEHPATIRFIEDIKTAFKEEIIKNGGYSTDGSFELDLVGHPRFNESNFLYIGEGDEDNGLRIAVNDVWDYDVKVVSYKEVEGKYYAEVQLILYDHFGLDASDITDHYYSDIYPAFNSWFILQWSRGYKSFITIMHIPTFVISGSVPKG